METAKIIQVVPVGSRLHLPNAVATHFIRRIKKLPGIFQIDQQIMEGSAICNLKDAIGGHYIGKLLVGKTENILPEIEFSKPYEGAIEGSASISMMGIKYQECQALAFDVYSKLFALENINATQSADDLKNRINTLKNQQKTPGIDLIIDELVEDLRHYESEDGNKIAYRISQKIITHERVKEPFSAEMNGGKGTVSRKELRNFNNNIARIAAKDEKTELLIEEFQKIVDVVEGMFTIMAVEFFGAAHQDFGGRDGESQLDLPFTLPTKANRPAMES